MLQLDNYRTLSEFCGKDLKPMKLWRQENEQKACPRCLSILDSLHESRLTPIPFDEVMERFQVSIEVAAFLYPV